jgi:hypothetical protein
LRRSSKASTTSSAIEINVPNPSQYLAKAELAAKIHQIVLRRRLTQAEAGKVMRTHGLVKVMAG